jgi:Plasmid pRiA4b ORF-3-like protein
MSAPTIACLRIVLEDVRPRVSRRVEVPLSIPLDQLHLVIQAAMGWDNSHLYEIVAGNLTWGFVDPDNEASRLDAEKVLLCDVIGYAKALNYLYDFGDGWDHTITVEDIINPAPASLYPRLVEVEGRCPPEDVGGPGGYARFREAIINPFHRRHAEYKDWIGATSIPISSTPVVSHGMSGYWPNAGRREPYARQQTNLYPLN